MKRIAARFFRTASGAEPVRDWLLCLDAADRRIVGKDIATVEFGWPIGMPICRDLRDGIREVRSTVRNGKVEARVYFCVEGDVMLLLHSHLGKDGQQEAIRLALKRKKS